MSSQAISKVKKPMKKKIPRVRTYGDTQKYTFGEEG